MQAPLDRRTDIFSLGACCSSCSPGSRLREITDEVAGWSQVASGVVPSARSCGPILPAAVEQLLESALAADPRDALSRRAPRSAPRFAARSGSAQRRRSVRATWRRCCAACHAAAGARTLMPERSKVIRLGPEAEALKRGDRRPATPAPVLTNPRGKTVNLADPGPTPPVRSLTPGRTPAARSFTPARTPAARSLTPGRTPAARSLTPGRTPAARSLTPGARPPRAASRPGAARRTRPRPRAPRRAARQRTTPRPIRWPHRPRRRRYRRHARVATRR